MKINVNALTEKGVLKPLVRKQIAEYVSKNRGLFAKATKIADKNTYSIEITDADGNIIYIAFDVVVTEKNPANRSRKKPSAKASEAIEFEFETE
jgi:hypothetical protein